VDAEEEPGRARTRRGVLAGLFGTIIEYYDFSVYGFLVVFMGPLFFPSDNPATGILATLGVYAAGYFARPLGGLFFGSLGDRRGRRFALLVTIVGMGVATTVMGLLPTYATIGALAPVLLVLARMVQGFSAGGEVTGSATFVAESDGGRNRGMLQGIMPLGASIGVAAAPAAVGLVAVIVGREAMADWGWRLPLLFSALMTVLVLVYRTRLEDSTEFQSLEEAGRVEKAPVRSAVRAHWRMILATVVLVLAIGMTSAVLVSYMSVYMLTVVKIPQGTVYWLSAVCLLLSSVGYFLGGWLTDHIGRRISLLVGWGGSAVLIFPVMYGMTAIGSNGAWALLGVGLLYTVALGLNYSSTPAVHVTFTQAFPTGVRYTAASIGYNVGVVLGGGLTPYLAAQLTASTGAPQAAGWLLVFGAIAGITTMIILTSRRRATAPLAAEPSTP
jgi:MHS family proline/betaine transporter-like MFS transporter